MTNSNLKRLKTRIKTFKSTLQSATTSARQQKAGVQTIKLLNSLISEVGDSFPDLGMWLPETLLTSAGTMSERRAGISNHSYLDVEIAVDQVLAALESVDES